jgi:hypothetical protein
MLIVRRSWKFHTGLPQSPLPGAFGAEMGQPDAPAILRQLFIDR